MSKDSDLKIKNIIKLFKKVEINNIKYYLYSKDILLNNKLFSIYNLRINLKIDIDYAQKHYILRYKKNDYLWIRLYKLSKIFNFEYNLNKSRYLYVNFFKKFFNNPNLKITFIKET